MVWGVPDMLAFLSQLYRLEPGDLVFTGTPAGVGPVVVGDRLNGRIAGLTSLAIDIVAAES
jgi:fumarylpyruvate hydrolase